MPLESEQKRARHPWVFPAVSSRVLFLIDGPDFDCVSVAVWSVTAHPEQAATSECGRGRKSEGTTGNRVEVRTLAPRGQIAQFLDQTFFSAEMSDLLRSVRCISPGEGVFSVVALEMDPGTRTFTTLSVVPVPKTPFRE